MGYDTQRKSVYKMDQDVHSFILLDKDSTLFKERWKIVVVFKGSAIKQIVEDKSGSQTLPNHLVFKQIRDQVPGSAS